MLRLPAASVSGGEEHFRSRLSGCSCPVASTSWALADVQPALFARIAIGPWHDGMLHCPALTVDLSASVAVVAWSSFSASLLHASCSHFPAVGILPQSFSFVVYFSTAAKSDTQLCDAPLEEHL